MDSREYGLFLGNVLLRYFTKSMHLHYGLWDTNDSVELHNLGQAQEAYVDLLCENLPKGTKTILDVGCGYGSLSKRLSDEGYALEALSPSAFINQEVRKQLPHVLVHDTTFEEFSTPKTFDLLIFSESFQYIDLPTVFEKCRPLLNLGGHIMLCDKFKLEEKGKSPIGGGHSYQAYLDTCAQQKARIITDIDITEKIAPTFDLLKGIMDDLVLPLTERVAYLSRQKIPTKNKLMLKTLLFFLNKAAAKHRKPGRDGQGFAEYNTYRLNVLSLEDEQQTL